MRLEADHVWRHLASPAVTPVSASKMAHPTGFEPVTSAFGELRLAGWDADSCTFLQRMEAGRIKKIP